MCLSPSLGRHKDLGPLPFTWVRQSSPGLYWGNKEQLVSILIVTVFVCLLQNLGIELRAWHRLGKCPIT
jgi:hypothetical protein